MRTREEYLKMWADTDICPDFEPMLKELLDERDKLIQSLTPSPETKATYDGEFYVPVRLPDHSSDEDGLFHEHRIKVPWTVIQKILTRALWRAQG